MLGLVAAVGPGCTELPEAMTFDHSSGTGANLRDCICAYDDGSSGAAVTLEFTCTAGNDTIATMSLFADPRNTNGPGDGRLIYIPTHVPANYVGFAAATIDPIGPARDPNAQKVIRDVTNIAFAWADQIDCNPAQPCTIDSFHLVPGAVSGGHGGCEDQNASLANQLK